MLFYVSVVNYFLSVDSILLYKCTKQCLNTEKFKDIWVVYTSLAPTNKAAVNIF